MPKPETFLFDMDGVLCDYDFAGRLDRLETALGIAAAEIEAKIFKSGFEDEADLGVYDSTDYLTEISRRLGVRVDRQAWLDARAGAMTPNPEMLNLVGDIMKDHDVALMTNNGALLAEAIDDIFPALRELFGAQLVFSSDVGASKEDAGTFPLLMARFGWTAETTLFIDDSETYIAAGRDAGLRTHLFRDYAGLRAALAA